MTHWMDTGTFEDTLDEDTPAAPTINPLLLLAQQLATKFSPLGDWIKQGVCHTGDVDVSVWDGLPSREDIADMPADQRPTAAELARKQRTAASLCAACPVRAECLADAIDNRNTIATIRGGVLFGDNPNSRTEFDLIDLLHRGALNSTPAGRGRPAAA